MARRWVAVAVALVVMAGPAVASADAPRAERRRPADSAPEIGEFMAALAPVLEALAAGEGALRTRRPTERLEQAPRLLAEALRTGTIDMQSWGTIAQWVLVEKEEKVAAGLASALEGVRPAGSSVDAERWNATTAAVLGAFQTVLRDAQANRAQDGEAILRSLTAVAAPAIAAALSEADTSASRKPLEAVRDVVKAEEMAATVVRGLRHEDPSVRRAAASLLGALGASARAAVPDLQAALQDADPAVRADAAAALKKIEAE